MNRTTTLRIALPLAVLAAVVAGLWLRPTPVPEGTAPSSTYDADEPPSPIGAPPSPRSPAATASRTPSEPRDLPRSAPPVGAASTASSASSPPAEDVDTDIDTYATPRSVWGLDRDSIHGAIREVMPTVRHCYGGWLAEDPTIEGRIDLEIIIAEDEEELGIARAVATVAEADTGSAAFEACVAQVLSEMMFDVPEDGALTVNYPILFSPG